jgi:predicted molibdopterin-dependent oxidoreductase YjgC
MFKRLPDDKRPAIALSIDGKTIEAREGDNVAAALLAAGVTVARTTPVSEAARGPYCMMGVCFDCLMEIDGIGSRQACLVPVRAGMVVRTQHGARKL